MHLKISELKNSELKRFFLKKKAKSQTKFFTFLADSHIALATYENGRYSLTNNYR